MSVIRHNDAGSKFYVDMEHGDVFEEGADKRIYAVHITGEEFDKFYQKVYAKDKMNLAP